jgi:hypothetical protein
MVSMARMVITGNRLRDGAVVWRGAAGDWSRDIVAAAIHVTDGHLAKSLDAARLDEASGRIIGVYEVEIATRESRIVPTRLRERVRADGPTVFFA